MEMKKTAKKIMALVGGAVMAGATLAGAFAALDALPQPFVTSDGVFDSYVVVGTMGLVDDVAVGMDVAAAFAQKATTSATASHGTTTELAGDVWKIAKSGDNLDFGQNISDYGSVTDKEMSSLLKGSSITNEKGTFDYDQYIDLANSAKVIFTTDPDDDSNTPAWYLKFDALHPAYTYKVAFTQALQSDIVNSHLKDIEMKDIKLLGKDYTITKAVNTTNGIELTLMSGAVQATQGEYTTQTYTVGDKTYNVEVLIIADSDEPSGDIPVKLKVNGETTDALTAGQTYT